MTSSLAETIVPVPSRRPDLYEDDAERSRHLDLIASIARENDRSVAEVTDHYERILDDLKRHARVHDYLVVFVARKVEEQLPKLH